MFDSEVKIEKPITRKFQSDVGIENGFFKALERDDPVPSRRFTDLRLHIADNLVRLGKLEEAAEELRDYLGIHKSDAKGAYNLACVLSLICRDESRKTCSPKLGEARLFLTKAANLDPSIARRAIADKDLIALRKNKKTQSVFALLEQIQKKTR